MAQCYSKMVAGDLKVKFRVSLLLIMSTAVQNGQLHRAQTGDREDQSPCYYNGLWRHLASGIFSFLFRLQFICLKCNIIVHRDHATLLAKALSMLAI